MEAPDKCLRERSYSVISFHGYDDKQDSTADKGLCDSVENSGRLSLWKE